MYVLIRIGIGILIICFFIGIKIFTNLRKKKLIEDLKSNWGKVKECKRNFDLIQTYHNIIKNKECFQIIDKQTWKDLNLNDVFSFIDRTTSKVGQQYLFHKIKEIMKSTKELENFDSLIRFFQSNEELRLEIQLILQKMSNNSAYYIPEFFEDKLLKKPKWFWIVPALSIIPVLLIIGSFFNPVYFNMLIVSFLLNSIFHYRNKGNVYFYSETLPQLVKLMNAANEICSFEIEYSNIKSIRSKLGKVKVIKKKMFLINIQNSHQNELAMLFYAISELIKALFLIEFYSLFGTLKSIKDNRKELIDIFNFVGQIDSAISVASLRYGLDYYCTPDFTNFSKYMNLSKAYHPLISKCVPNDLKIHGKGMLITGSNMSGKTTYIRTIAINTLLAQTIFTCLAENYVAPFMKIFSSITIEDDILTGKSYYLEEVVRANQLLENSNKSEPCLFIIDEIFKGTNTTERIAAAKGISNYLTKGEDIVLISTHDIELIQYLNNNYELYHFEEDVINNTLVFDYKLKNGHLKTSNAIKILKMYKYPEEVLDEAYGIIEKSSKI